MASTPVNNLSRNKQMGSAATVDSADLQSMLNTIASEAKKRNPNGFTANTSPSKSKGVEESIYEPFVTPSGQHILFYNGKSDYKEHESF